MNETDRVLETRSSLSRGLLMKGPLSVYAFLSAKAIKSPYD